MPLLSTLHIDGEVLGWTVLIAVVAALLFGLFPGLRMASGNLQEALKDSGHGTSAGRRHESIRAALVVGDAGCTTRLLTTVLTPATWATSPLAMVRALSLVTLPLRVTMPLWTLA